MNLQQFNSLFATLQETIFLHIDDGKGGKAIVTLQSA
jgi:hypothetical protein